MDFVSPSGIGLNCGDDELRAWLLTKHTSNAVANIGETWTGRTDETRSCAQPVVLPNEGKAVLRGAHVASVTILMIP